MNTLLEKSFHWWLVVEYTNQGREVHYCVIGSKAAGTIIGKISTQLPTNYIFIMFIQTLFQKRMDRIWLFVNFFTPLARLSEF